MKNLIYQFWDSREDGQRVNLPGVAASWKSIKQYADRIGADHIVEKNPERLHKLHSSLYYGTFNPVFRDEFLEYDNVLFLDSDIHAVDGLEEDIFDGFAADIGICTEPLQPKLRARTKVGLVNIQQDELWAKHVEEKWNVTLPRTEEGFLKVYNTGMVMYSNQGMINARRKLLPFDEYINYVLSIEGLLPFYAADQNYLHAALFTSNINFVEMDNGWNTLVTVHERNHQRIIFDRDANTKLVHVMGLVGAGHWSEEQLWKITNLPVKDWGMNKKNVTEEIKR